MLLLPSPWNLCSINIWRLCTPCTLRCVSTRLPFLVLVCLCAIAPNLPFAFFWVHCSSFKTQFSFLLHKPSLVQCTSSPYSYPRDHVSITLTTLYQTLSGTFIKLWALWEQECVLFIFVSPMQRLEQCLAHSRHFISICSSELQRPRRGPHKPCVCLWRSGNSDRTSVCVYCPEWLDMNY